MKLNKEKVKLTQSEVPYIRHLLIDKGLNPHPGKIKAVLEMPKPTDVAGVHRLMGFDNYLNKFLSHRREI